MNSKNMKIFNVLLFSSSLLSLSSTQAFSTERQLSGIQTIFAQLRNSRVNNFVINGTKNQAVGTQTSPHLFISNFGGLNRMTPVAQHAAPSTVLQNGFMGLLGGLKHAAPVAQHAAPSTALQNGFIGLLGGPNNIQNSAFVSSPASTPIKAPPFNASSITPKYVFPSAPNWPKPISIQDYVQNPLKDYSSNQYVGPQGLFRRRMSNPSVKVIEVDIQTKIMKQDPSTTIETLRQKMSFDSAKNQWATMNDVNKVFFILRNISNNTFSFKRYGFEVSQAEKDILKNHELNCLARTFSLYNFRLPNNFNDFINNFTSHITPILNELKIKLGQDSTNIFKNYPKVTPIYMNADDIIKNWPSMTQEQKIIDDVNNCVTVKLFSMIDSLPQYKVKTISAANINERKSLGIDKFSYEINKYLSSNNIKIPNNYNKYAELYGSKISPFLQSLGVDSINNERKSLSHQSEKELIKQQRVDEREQVLTWLTNTQQVLSQKTEEEKTNILMNNHFRNLARYWPYLSNDQKVLKTLDSLFNNNQLKALTNFSLTPEEINNIKIKIPKIVRSTNIQFPDTIEHFVENIETYARPIFSKYGIDEDPIS